MNIKYNFLQLLFFLLPLSLCAQSPADLGSLPAIISTKIPGALVLGQPQRIVGTEMPVIAEGFGLAAPAFYDWDGDGNKDLLIGEFGSGMEHKRYAGNFIRVFNNQGTEKAPHFSGEFQYATPPFAYKAMGNGTPYSVDQYCCIGITPQFIDLDQDGRMDMISGTYQGEVIWFRGTEQGFLPGQALNQKGDPRDKDQDSGYWVYSSASFGDLTGDGLADLVTGGRSLRISKNIGTAAAPRFAGREFLKDVNGNDLQVYHNDKERAWWKTSPLNVVGAPGGDVDLSPYVVDWDQDGVLDLLVTNSYSHQGLAAVDFFKGVKVKGEQRFEQPVPLFTTSGGGKAFPGSGPRICVADYNNDGVPDLLIGASIPTVNGQWHKALAMDWEADNELHGAGKDLGFFTFTGDRLALQRRYHTERGLPKGISIDDYLTIRHQGCVYVLLGSSK